MRTARKSPASSGIALSRKRLLEDPWEIASDRYHEGQLVEGTVTNVVDFGAFVEFLPGCEGLVHVSELANFRVKKVEDIVQLGDEITGVVKLATPLVVHLGEVAGREFFDAVVDTKRVVAVLVRVK